MTPPRRHIEQIARMLRDGDRCSLRELRETRRIRRLCVNHAHSEVWKCIRVRMNHVEIRKIGWRIEEPFFGTEVCEREVVRDVLVQGGHRSLLTHPHPWLIEKILRVENRKRDTQIAHHLDGYHGAGGIGRPGIVYLHEMLPNEIS